MKEGWGTKTDCKKVTRWHFYRNGRALCNQGNYLLDVNQLKNSPEISQDSNNVICQKCREKWSLKK